MKDFDDDYEEEGNGGRMFDFQDLFQGADDGTISFEYANDMTIKEQILDASLRLLQSSFWWKFRSSNTQLQMLIMTYNNLHTLVMGDINDEIDGVNDKEKKKGEEI